MFSYLQVLVVSIILNYSTASYNHDTWNEFGKKIEKKGVDTIELWKDAEGGSSSGNLLKQYRHRREQFPTSSGSYKVPKNHVLLDYGYGHNPRQLTSFATTNLLGQSQVSPNELIYSMGGNAGGSDEDNVVAAGGHGHSQHGWGWGHGQGKGCNSALGLLGVLGLASYLQNVLRQMGGLGGGLGGGGAVGGGGGAGGGAGTGGGGTINPGGGGRKKRSATFDYDAFPDPTVEMVPHLLHLNQIRTNAWPPLCSSQPVCMLSKIVSKGLGETQRKLVKTTLKAVVSELLDSYGEPKKRSKLHKLIENAATEGMKDGTNCKEAYQDCRIPRQMYKKTNKNLIM